MAAMYRSWGFSPASTSLAVVCTALWNTLVKLGLPLVAIALLAVSGGASVGRLAVAAGGIGVVVAVVIVTTRLIRDDRFTRWVAVRSERVVSAMRRLVRRGPVTGWGEAASAFRGGAWELVQGRWARLTATTMLSQLSACAVLYLAVRGVGVSGHVVGWIEVLGAFAFVRLLAIVPVSPGGVGVVELGLSGALIAAGAPRGPAVAAVVVFRALTYLAPMVAGPFGFVVWRTRSSWRVVV